MNPHELGNYAGDNLVDDEDDELDENEFFNWTNHPIRKLFDNENKAHFHPSYLDKYRKQETNKDNEP